MKNYITYKCKTCGAEFSMEKKFVDHSNNYVTCPLHGKHDKVIVIGAYDRFEDCMQERAYKRNAHGAIEQAKP